MKSRVINSKMKWNIVIFSTTFVILFISILSAATPPSKFAVKPVVGKQADKIEKKSRVTLKEAQGQAKLLHETFHMTLHVVHRQYFRHNEKVQIPSRTLDTVFEELSSKRDIEFNWISVNAQAMNIDHEPETKFQKAAAKAIASGKDSYEKIEDGIYRIAGKVLLLNQCLKCHLPDRTSTKTRFAALIISMKLKK